MFQKSGKLTYNTFVLIAVKNVSDDVWLLSGYGLPSVQLKFIKLFIFKIFFKKINVSGIWSFQLTFPHILHIPS